MQKTKSRLKILMYSDKFGSPTTTFIYNDLLGVSKHHTIKYLCVSKGDADFKFDDITVINYQRNYFKRKFYAFIEKYAHKLSFYNKHFSKEVNNLISQFSPDIIQCNFGVEALRLIDNLNEQNAKLPIVINFLGYDASLQLTNKSYVSRLRKLAKQKNIFVTSNCHFLKNNLEKKEILFNYHDIIYTGVDVNYFSRAGYIPPSDNFVFLNLAVLSHRKGQEFTIRAFHKFLSIVAHPEKYKLILAGGAEIKSEEIRIKNIVSSFSLTSNVEFTGWVSREQSKNLLLNANVYVHHSVTDNGRTEGMPTIISEAMAMELPIISTWHAGIPEQVEDGVNGYLVNECDVDLYAQKMKEIVNWKFLKINREKVEKNFSIDMRVNNLLKLYSYISDLQN